MDQTGENTLLSSKRQSQNEDSSDEEGDQDLSLTYNNSTMERSFKFYEFGVPDVPFSNILDQLAEQKEKYKQTMKPKKPKATKTFDIRAYQNTMLSKDLSMSKTVARFHPVEAKWEGTKTLDEQMLKDIYRIPSRDPTGKIILSLSRDEAKGCTVWKKPEVGKDIDPPNFAQCSITFQMQALKHMDEAIAKVEEEYHRLPTNSIAKSNYKSKVGADLNNLKREREKSVLEMAEYKHIHHHSHSHSQPPSQQQQQQQSSSASLPKETTVDVTAKEEEEEVEKQ